MWNNVTKIPRRYLLLYLKYQENQGERGRIFHLLAGEVLIVLGSLKDFQSLSNLSILLRSRWQKSQTDLLGKIMSRQHRKAFNFLEEARARVLWQSGKENE